MNHLRTANECLIGGAYYNYHNVLFYNREKKRARLLIGRDVVIFQTIKNVMKPLSGHSLFQAFKR